VTENLSSGGARLAVSAPPVGFDIVRLVARNIRFESLAAIRNRFSTSDGFERLCVEFIDRKWPV
jgi:hypothetical protein